MSDESAGWVGYVLYAVDDDRSGNVTVACDIGNRPDSDNMSSGWGPLDRRHPHCAEHTSPKQLALMMGIVACVAYIIVAIDASLHLELAG